MLFRSEDLADFVQADIRILNVAVAFDIFQKACQELSTQNRLFFAQGIAQAVVPYSGKSGQAARHEHNSGSGRKPGVEIVQLDTKARSCDSEFL